MNKANNTKLEKIKKYTELFYETEFTSHDHGAKSGHKKVEYQTINSQKIREREELAAEIYDYYKDMPEEIKEIKMIWGKIAKDAACFKEASRE